MDKSDLESVKVCPRCGNETSEEILNDIDRCFFCGNTDFSEEAYLLPDDSIKINCYLCGGLAASDEMHHYNPMFYKFSKKIDVSPFDWVDLCPECDSEINAKKYFTIIKKIIDFHGRKRRRRPQRRRLQT